MNKNNWKKLLLNFIYPHIAVLIVAAPIAAAGLVYSFAVPRAIPVLQYCSYGISAYALLILCFRLPRIIKRIKEYKEKNKYIARYASDGSLRVKISLAAVVSVNLIYAGFNIFLGFVNHSVWFYALAGYYVLLTLIRSFLLGDTYKKAEISKLNQWRRYRFCGILLIAMNIVLAGIVFYIVRQNRGFSYHFIQAIAMAAYTFTVTSFAIVNVIRYRKNSQPLISAVKIISLVSALVSMLSLENAMLNVFGEADGEALRRLMTALTGGAVCIIVLAIGIYMVAKSTAVISENKQRS